MSKRHSLREYSIMRDAIAAAAAAASAASAASAADDDDDNDDDDDKHIPSKTSRSISSVSWITPAITRWVGRQDSVGPAPQFFGSGGPQTGVWSTKTTKDGKCLSVIFIFW